jgi:malonyl CoA-acyl carrier protein transacylase
VSSFSFSGTNAHVILEEAPSSEGLQAITKHPWHLLTLSAKTEEALKQLSQRYENYLAAHPDLALEDICFTSNVGRSHFEYRLAVVAESNRKLRDELTAFSAGQETAGLVSGQIHSSSPKIAFLFTGQGSQYVGMGRELYETQPTFRTTLDRCDKILHPYLGYSLLKVLYPEPSVASPIDETAFTQPALFAIEFSLTELWRSWGIEPNVVMGHSVGEYVAACVAGLFSLEDGLKLIATRAKLMQALPPGGAMVAVFASQEVVAATLKPFAHQVTIAAVNGPQNIVISGEGEAIRHIVATLEVVGIKTVQLKVSHAFHSPLMEPTLTEFKQVASEITFFSPELELMSNVTGELATADIATPEYWCRHVMQPVQFASSIKRLHQTGYDIFIECGPKPTLLGMGRQSLPEGVGLWLPSLHPQQEDWQRMLQSLGELYVRGVSIDWHSLNQGYSWRKVALPTYPFQRKRYWLTSDQSQVATAARSDNGISTNGMQTNNNDTNGTQNGTKFNGTGAQVNSLQKQVNQNQTLQKAEVLLRQTAVLLPQLIELVLDGRQQTSTEHPGYNATDFGEGETHFIQQLPLLVQHLERIPANERLDALIHHLQQEIAWLLRLDSSELPDPKIGLFRMGMDSIQAFELQKRLEASLGCLISSTTIFNYPNIQSLAKHLLSDVLGLTTTENQMLDEDKLVQAVSEIEHLSEAEAEALLIQKLANL